MASTSVGFRKKDKLSKMAEFKPTISTLCMSDTFTRGYALLIGVGECTYPKWSLPVTVKDVQALRAILTDPNLCAYPNNDQHIRLLYDAAATRTAILDGLVWLKEQAAADPESTVVIYYSGHGWLDQSTESYYLIPHDVEPFDISSSALSAADFNDALRQIQSQRLLVIIDCCHAQGMAAAKTGEAGIKLPPGFVPAGTAKELLELAKGEGRAVFTSCRGSQKSWIRKDGSLSIYTYHLIEALQGAANQPGDTKVGIADIMGHLGRAVPESAFQEYQATQEPWFSCETTNFPIAFLCGGKGLPAEGWDAVKESPINFTSNIVQAAGPGSVAIGGKADNSTILAKSDGNVVGSGNVVGRGNKIYPKKPKDSADSGKVKSFEPLPGQVQPIAPTKYVCPNTGCDISWVRRSVGQPIPKCSIHDVELIPVPKS